MKTSIKFGVRCATPQVDAAVAMAGMSNNQVHLRCQTHGAQILYAVEGRREWFSGAVHRACYYTISSIPGIIAGSQPALKLSFNRPGPRFQPARVSRATMVCVCVCVCV